MIRLIYNLFWPVGLLFFLPGYLMKMVRRGGYREKFGQRLGIYDRELRARLLPEWREEANMAARGQRGRSHGCPEAGPAAPNA